MVGEPQEPEVPVPPSVAHYAAVSGEYKDYYGMYMQSWSIVGSVLFLGFVMGLGGFEVPGWTDGAKGAAGGSAPLPSPVAAEAKRPDGPALQDILVCAMPLVLLLWFMLTSYFWAYFRMYRGYLGRLEARIHLGAQGVLPLEGEVPLLGLHTYRRPWFENKRVEKFDVLVAILGFLLYVVLSLAGADRAGRLSGGNPCYAWHVAYLAVGAYAFCRAHRSVGETAACDRGLLPPRVGAARPA